MSKFHVFSAKNLPNLRKNSEKKNKKIKQKIKAMKKTKRLKKAGKSREVSSRLESRKNVHHYLLAERNDFYHYLDVILYIKGIGEWGN